MAYKRVVVNGRRKTKKRTAKKASKKAAKKRNVKKAPKRRPAKKAAKKRPKKAAKKHNVKKAPKRRTAKKATKKRPKKAANKGHQVGRVFTSTSPVSATTKRNKKKPTAKQLAARAAFTRNYGGKKATKKKAAKKRNPPVTPTGYAYAASGSKVVSRKRAKGPRSPIMPGGGAIARKVAKELADVQRALNEGIDRCRKTEQALKTDLGTAKRKLKSARSQLTKARNKIRSLESKIGDMKADQVKALRAAQRKAKTLGVEAVRLGKLVQYYTYDGKQKKRKGGKSLVGTKSRKRVCKPGVAKRASKSAKKVRAGESSGSGLAYERWCAGVRRNFNNYKQPLE